jgi:hypothetical protein
MLFSQKDKTPSRKKNNNDFLGGVPPFNPLTFDTANLIALYDADVGVTPGFPPPQTAWADQSANGFDLTLVNGPTLIFGAINGHRALQFDGVNQYGQNNNAGYIRNQPHTFYMVFNQLTWTIGDHFSDAAIVVNSATFFQSDGSPNMKLFAGTANANILNPQLALSTYGIVTGVFNGANSEIRNNNNVAVIANPGVSNAIGLTLASNSALTQFGNIEVAYLIIRSGADSTATQNLFINYLKNRFAL